MRLNGTVADVQSKFLGRTEQWTPLGVAPSLCFSRYNEALNLEGSVADALVACSDFDDYEILIVNDGSTDGTRALADQLAATLDHVRVIHHVTNRGFGAAYGTALAEARMSYFTFVPGDHEIAPESVTQIFGEVGKADLVVPFHATPWKRPFLRRALTWISTTQVNLLFGWNLKYYQGPVVYPTELARLLPRTTPGFYFATEMLVHAARRGLLVCRGWPHPPRADLRSVQSRGLVERRERAMRSSSNCGGTFVCGARMNVRAHYQLNLAEPTGALEGANL